MEISGFLGILFLAVTIAKFRCFQGIRNFIGAFLKPEKLNRRSLSHWRTSFGPLSHWCASKYLKFEISDFITASWLVRPQNIGKLKFHKVRGLGINTKFLGHLASTPTTRATCPTYQ